MDGARSAEKRLIDETTEPNGFFLPNSGDLCEERADFLALF